MRNVTDSSSWRASVDSLSSSDRNATTRIVGCSPAILAALKLADQVARSEIPVLIVGETGTGKELFARYVHERSGRSGTLACVDCASLPDEIAESILFGHNRGSFTGAVRQTEGLLSQAHGGTLFLDELSSLSSRGQAKLLRVLETGYVQRIGATSSRRADFRVVATVQDDFSAMLSSGQFRSDLLQRIAGVIIRLPRLSDRVGDIPVLARYFAHCAGVGLSPEAESSLRRHSWPGNVRELRWTVVRAALFTESGVIDDQALESAQGLGPRSLIDEGAQESKAAQRERHLRVACEEHQGDPALIARALGIGRSTLYRWLKDARVDLRDFRSRALEA